MGDVLASGHFNLSLTDEMRLNLKENWALKYRSFTLSSIGRYLIGSSTSTDALLAYGCPSGMSLFTRVNGLGAGGIKGGATVGAMIPASKALKVGVEGQFGEGKVLKLMIL